LVAQGNEKAIQITKTMVYSISKEIGAMACALEGEVDAIVITGGLATWDWLVDCIRERVSFLAPFLVHRENVEMVALATGALRVLDGREQALIYS
ncbi:butyrate kinase, partial [Planctomycetota bacterium]